MIQIYFLDGFFFLPVSARREICLDFVRFFKNLFGDFRMRDGVISCHAEDVAWKTFKSRSWWDTFSIVLNPKQNRIYRPDFWVQGYILHDS
jgi:hypothetical protein